MYSRFLSSGAVGLCRYAIKSTLPATGTKKNVNRIPVLVTVLWTLYVKSANNPLKLRKILENLGFCGHSNTHGSIIP